MALQAIIFDFDGVLADTLEDMLRFAAEACRQLGHPCQPTPADLDALEQMSFTDYGRQLGIPEHLLVEFTNYCLECFSTHTQPPQIFPGLADVLRQLARSYPLAIVTGNTTATVQATLEGHSLEGLFKVILDVHQPGKRFEKIARAAAMLGVPVGATLVVGDAVSDIRASAQAGALSGAVGWGHQSISRLGQANPDYLFKTPNDLLDIL